MKKRVAICCSIVLLLPVFYCLSIGPVLKLAQIGVLPSEVGRMQDPLLPLMNSCPRFAGAMIWYQELWVPPPPEGPRVALPPSGAPTRPAGK